MRTEYLVNPKESGNSFHFSYQSLEQVFWLQWEEKGQTKLAIALKGLDAVGPKAALGEDAKVAWELLYALKGSEAENFKKDFEAKTGRDWDSLSTNVADENRMTHRYVISYGLLWAEQKALELRQAWGLNSEFKPKEKKIQPKNV